MANNKMLTRDVKRRVTVIEKKIGDLQNMGVPCVFAYATSWTGGLYVCGDKRMAKCLKNSSSDLFQSLKEPSTSARTDDGGVASKLCLPKLPRKLSALNSKTAISMLVGLAKDLSLDWTGPVPEWWPELVPFQHPRDPVPATYRGIASLVLLIT